MIDPATVAEYERLKKAYPDVPPYMIRQLLSKPVDDIEYSLQAIQAIQNEPNPDGWPEWEQDPIQKEKPNMQTRNPKDFLTATELERYDKERRYLLATDSLSIEEAERLALARAVRSHDVDTKPPSGIGDSAPAVGGKRPSGAQRPGPGWLHERGVWVSYYHGLIVIAGAVFLGIFLGAYYF